MCVKISLLSMTCVARIACLVLTLQGGILTAHGDEIDCFNSAVEAASAHNRVAIGYLRTGNADLASLEIDRLRDSWILLTERFSGKRPSAFEGNALYSKLFTWRQRTACQRRHHAQDGTARCCPRRTRCHPGRPL